MDYRIEQFGLEQEPIVIIDDFYSNPDRLVQHAAQLSFNQNNSYYPGIRAQAPSEYLAERMSLLTDILKNIFDIKLGAQLLDCNYSLVTIRPEQLIPFQCFPHFDGLERGRIAVLHYLCDAVQGGTAFYRHKKTGFETLNKHRHASYTHAREAEFKQLGLKEKSYMIGSTDEFEQIGNIHARPNRMIIYRGCTLHSGLIPQNFNYSPDPKKGRLTINTFLMDKTELVHS